LCKDAREATSKRRKCSRGEDEREEEAGEVAQELGKPERAAHLP